MPVILEAEEGEPVYVFSRFGKKPVVRDRMGLPADASKGERFDLSRIQPVKKADIHPARDRSVRPGTSRQNFDFLAVFREPIRLRAWYISC